MTRIEALSNPGLTHDTAATNAAKNIKNNQNLTYSPQKNHRSPISARFEIKPKQPHSIKESSKDESEAELLSSSRRRQNEMSDDPPRKKGSISELMSKLKNI